MQNILIISTGGTFNKVYNRVSGELEIDNNSKSLKHIEECWLTNLNYINIIGKDSLDFTNSDRERLLTAIKESKYSKIIIIHGTDTIDKSAIYISQNCLDKTIVFTGAMVPFSIESIEATANLALAIGYSKLANSGVYIALNGVVDSYSNIIKNRELGLFTKV